MKKNQKRKEEKEMPYRQEIYNIAITISHLEKIIKKSKANNLDNFLQKEIFRLRERKKKLIENG